MTDSAHPYANMFIGFLLLFIIAGLTAYYADQKGRNAPAWFVIGILIGLLAPLILFFLPSLKTEEEESKNSTKREPFSSLSPPILPSALPPPQQQISLIDDKLWYYLDQDHQQYGPISIIGLKELFDTGQVDLNSYVWSEGMEKWEKIDRLPALKEAFKHYQG